jgi:hypothetical protein
MSVQNSPCKAIVKVATNIANPILFACVILTTTLSNIIGQTILPDINLIGNSVDDPGSLKRYLAFQ